MKSRIIILGFWVILFATLVVIISQTVDAELNEADLNILSTGTTPSIPVEQGVFRRSHLAEEYADATYMGAETGRSLEEYHDRRAFPGAPPTIPHSLDALVSEGSIGGKSCLQCHQNGGYVEQFEAYAPVTPHPEFLNCRQCHVPTSTGLFKETNWEKILPPERHQALPGSPPVIPHGLQMRENCLACHAGPAAPKEIRVSHPERLNCRQCHAATNELVSTIEWVRTEEPN